MKFIDIQQSYRSADQELDRSGRRDVLIIARQLVRSKAVPLQGIAHADVVCS